MYGDVSIAEFRDGLTDDELVLFDPAWRAALAAESAFAKAMKSAQTKAPSWLDPAYEITSPNTDSFTPGQFAVTLVPLIMSIDRSISGDRAFELAAHFAGETGFGRHFRGNNLGGVKINQALIRAYQRDHGVYPRWWAAAGHTAQGDAPTVYYMGYPSLKVFLMDWLARFVPRPGTAPKSRYAETGRLFWDPSSEPGAWFYAMLRAGYRGETSDEQKAGSMRAFFSIIDRLKRLFVQVTVGARATGTWNAETTRLTAEWQRRHGLQPTGQLNDATLSAMVGAQVHAKRFNAGASSVLLIAAMSGAGYMLWKAQKDSKAKARRK